MDIIFLDQPKMNLRSILKTNNINIKTEGLDVDFVYTHRTPVDEYSYRYVLCPMTGTGHLKVHPDKLIYLDNKKYLYQNVWSTAEYTMSLISRLCRGVRREIRGKTIGLVGYGRVAQQVAKLLQGYAPKKILWYDIESNLYEPEYTATRVDDLELIFKLSDVISIHLPENAVTKDSIKLELFNKCENNPLIINTARASIIRYTDLLTAFEDGVVAGMALDIDYDYVETYYKYTWDKLLKLNHVYQGCILSPHIAGKCVESRLATDKYVFNKLFKTIGGKLIK
jgi:phosphoglycerate dehydrogenase-like enzyme